MAGDAVEPSSGMPGADGKLVVAIVAEHASLRFGGEAALPLQYFRLLRQHGIEAYLVVHSRSRCELEGMLPGERGRILFVLDTILHRILYRTGERLPDRVRTFTTTWLMHLLTQVHQRRIVRHLVRHHGVRIVHEPIPVSPKLPSLMYNLGVPVIIGPMNGGMTYPPGFAHLESGLERAFLSLGRWLAGMASGLIPGKRRAALLLVANERTRRALPPGVSRNVVQLVENGVDLRSWSDPDRNRAQAGPVRFVFVGRLIALKMVDLLLYALRQVAATFDARLDIIGDGPERPRLVCLAEQLQLTSRVTFHGFIPQHCVPSLLSQADALVLPSVKECGGAVVLEAMAMALPVIAIDWGGPADYLDISSGILIPPTSRAGVIRDLAQAMEQLAKSPALRAHLGQAGRARVIRHFTWEQKITTILNLYTSCIHVASV